VVNTIFKIGIIGPEATGKSTLAFELAQHFKTLYVPEYARIFLENNNNSYTKNDLLKIAQGQLQLENDAILKANDILICDTTLHVIKIWSEVKYNACDLAILNNLTTNHYDLILLTQIDLPWQEDVQREHPALKDRQMLYKMYLENVIESKMPFEIIDGIAAARTQKAFEIIDKIYQQRKG
jgi:NadR type nicotinamide-nucleotide adenylyltransferase